MKVKLTKRLGQNKPGSTIEVTDTEAEWLIDHGHAEETKQESKTASRRGKAAAGDSDE